MGQQQQYTKRQVWIVSEVERVVSYWRLCSPLAPSDISTAVEVLEPFETPILIEAFKSLKQYDPYRAVEKRAPGVRDIHEACNMVKRRLDRERAEAENRLPPERQLDMTPAEREYRKKDNDEKAREFFSTMRAQLGIDQAPGAERSRSKDPMTSMADMLPSTPEERKAAD